MTLDIAKEIVTWVYEPPYDLYSFSGQKDEIIELFDGSYYSCFDSNGELIGYFCYGKNAQVPGGWKAEIYNDNNVLDIGLGMKPSLVGQGLGKNFLMQGLIYGEKKYKAEQVRLSVATFNQRAIKLYKRLGFEEGQRFFNNGVEFMLMEN